MITEFLSSTGFANITLGQVAMLGLGLFLLYLAIFKKYEPLLLVGIGFGIILGNLPVAGLMNPPSGLQPGGLLWYLFRGVELGIYPPLIFLGIGAMTDFSPLIAYPTTLLLGAAAQFGIFTSLLGAVALGFSPQEAGAIGIIGGADGPTAVFLAIKLAPHLLGPIAVAAYSYVALVPIIQPPIVTFLTTEEERSVEMKQLKAVTRKQKIVFPIFVTLLTALIVPFSLALVGMLMLGNLLRETGLTNRLADSVQNALINIITVFLTVTVGASASAERFFTPEFISIVLLGLTAFIIGTATGTLFGKLMHRLTGGRVNPLIGAAGVSAVPEAARTAQRLGRKANPKNFLLMHAMGPNVAGVIGSAVAAGVLLSIL